MTLAGVYEHVAGGQFRPLLEASNAQSGVRQVVYVDMTTGAVKVCDYSYWIEQVTNETDVPRPRFLLLKGTTN
jgi:hypothetical protein